MSQSVTLTEPATGSRAEIAVEQGFNCFRFSAVTGGRTVEVIDAPGDFAGGGHRPSSHGIPVLFPFPNRIRGGRYSWLGTEYEIPAAAGLQDPAGNAIHGFCLDRPWRVVERSDSSVTGEFHLSRDAASRRDSWPADFIFRLTYTLAENNSGGVSLRADFHIRNPGETPLPWGLGTHPYFQLPLSEDSSASNCLVQAPATRAWQLEDCLPTGEQSEIPASADLRDGRKFGTLTLDDVLTGLPSNGPTVCTLTDPTAGLQIVQESDSLFEHLVVYTPGERDAVCLEPYTCVTDAIHLQEPGLDTGLQVLRPGGTVETWITISCGPVVV